MQKKRHFIALDGLRGIAAITVAVRHLLELFPVFAFPPQGMLAVDFFFMLSGFVIGYAYEEKLRAGMTFRQFFAIRTIRLYPMVFIGVLLGVISRLPDVHNGTIGFHALLGASIFAFLLLPLPRLSLQPSAAFPINGPLWSLTFELVSNFLYASVVRWLSTRVLIVTAIISCLGLVAVSLSLDGVNGVGIVWGLTLPLGLVRVFAPFTIGLLIYRLGGHFHPSSNLLSIMAALLLVAVLWAPVQNGGMFDIIAILIVFPVVILMAARSPDEGMMRRSWKWLGAISYPIYTINHPLFRLASLGYMTARTSLGLAAMAGIALVGALAISWLMLRIYDDPVRKFLNGRWRGGA